MSTWIQVGMRYVNLDAVTEIRIHDQRRGSRVFFIGGGVLELDDDDTETLEAYLKQETMVLHPVRRSVSGPSHID